MVTGILSTSLGCSIRSDPGNAHSDECGLQRQEQALKDWMSRCLDFQLAEKLLGPGISAAYTGRNRLNGALRRFSRQEPPEALKTSFLMCGARVWVLPSAVTIPGFRLSGRQQEPRSLQCCPSFWLRPIPKPTRSRVLSWWISQDLRSSEQRRTFVASPPLLDRPGCPQIGSGFRLNDHAESI